MLWRLHRPPPPASLHSPWSAVHWYFILHDDDDDGDDDDSDDDNIDDDDDEDDRQVFTAPGARCIGIATQ